MYDDDALLSIQAETKTRKPKAFIFQVLRIIQRDLSRDLLFDDFLSYLKTNPQEIMIFMANRSVPRRWSVKLSGTVEGREILKWFINGASTVEIIELDKKTPAPIFAAEIVKKKTETKKSPPRARTRKPKIIKRVIFPSDAIESKEASMESGTLVIPANLRESFLIGFQGLDEAWHPRGAFPIIAGNENILQFRRLGIVPPKWIEIISEKESGPRLLARFNCITACRPSFRTPVVRLPEKTDPIQVKRTIDSGDKKKIKGGPKKPSVPKEMASIVLDKILQFSTLKSDFKIARFLGINNGMLCHWRKGRCLLPISYIKKIAKTCHSFGSADEFLDKIGVSGLIKEDENSPVPLSTIEKVLPPNVNQMKKIEAEKPVEVTSTPSKILSVEIKQAIEDALPIVQGLTSTPAAKKLGVNELAMEFLIGALVRDLPMYSFRSIEKTNLLLVEGKGGPFLINMEDYSF